MQINILEYLKKEIICTFYYEECEDHAERSKATRTESLLLLASERDRVFKLPSNFWADNYHITQLKELDIAENGKRNVVLVNNLLKVIQLHAKQIYFPLPCIFCSLEVKIPPCIFFFLKIEIPKTWSSRSSIVVPFEIAVHREQSQSHPKILKLSKDDNYSSREK